MSEAGPILAVESAVVRYGKLTAVDGLSLSVGEGETLGLVGESGCGKTSLAKALVRLLPLASGRILLDGIDTRSAAASAKSWLPQRIQLLFQDPVASLSPRLTIRRLLEEPLRIRRALTPNSWREVEGTFTELGLARDILDRYPHQLSGGQARRVSMVRALAMRPRIIVADEPTAGLDLSVQGEMLNLLAQVQRQRRLTYLVVSHNLNIVGRITDRVAVMYLGQIVELGATRRVFDRPAHHYTAALLAANPVLDPQHRRQRIVLKSELPSPLNPPSGCRFHPRCAAAQARCRIEAPVLREVAEGQQVACHFPYWALGLGRRAPSCRHCGESASRATCCQQLAARPGSPAFAGMTARGEASLSCGKSKMGTGAMAFTSLITATAADWQHVIAEEAAIPHARHVHDLLMMLLTQQRDDECYGPPINGYQHCLQTTTRALQAGESEEVIVCSLFHDVGEKMAPFSHGAVIADILQPFISERNEWMLRHHPAFQQYHFLQHPSADRHAREAFRGSPHFDYTARYCELYDQNSFDPDFATLPLEHFEPIVAAFFSRFERIDSLRLPA